MKILDLVILLFNENIKIRDPTLSIKMLDFVILFSNENIGLSDPTLQCLVSAPQVNIPFLLEAPKLPTWYVRTSIYFKPS
jgi:hypothetical protein